jgi:hypothetical protein
MTPKEKAEQLVNKMFNWIQGGSVIEYETAKECALIAVDEILKVASFYNDSQAEVTYWQEVKQEIEKL